MDRYQRMEKPKADTPIDENEIRITSQGRMQSYITYAMTLLQEKDRDEIVFKAMGRAINKTVTMVELVKVMACLSAKDKMELYRTIVKLEQDNADSGTSKSKSGQISRNW